MADTVCLRVFYFGIRQECQTRLGLWAGSRLWASLRAKYMWGMRAASVATVVAGVGSEQSLAEMEMRTVRGLVEAGAQGPVGAEVVGEQVLGPCPTELKNPTVGALW